jgi:hypothetical protein
MSPTCLVPEHSHWLLLSVIASFLTPSHYCPSGVQGTHHVPELPLGSKVALARAGSLSTHPWKLEEFCQSTDALGKQKEPVNMSSHLQRFNFSCILELAKEMQVCTFQFYQKTKRNKTNQELATITVFNNCDSPLFQYKVLSSPIPGLCCPAVGHNKRCKNFQFVYKTVNLANNNNCSRSFMSLDSESKLFKKNAMEK